MDNRFGVAVFLVVCCAWQARAAVNCTAAGRFADPADTSCQNYTLCVLNNATGTFLAYNYVCPTTSLFNPGTAQCTANTNYVCNVTLTNTTASVCTADGFIADPNATNCTTYIQCVQINGTFVQTSYPCPAGTFYDPASTLCEADYTCPTPAFTCAAAGAGRFANSSDTTCQRYIYCVLASNGTYLQYNYTCPTTSVFNPSSSRCTTSYTCPTS